ncbi:hypothetical protein [Streptomyces sp. NPDC048462]|uniref:hypothetical protein n=1 Tax=Streptomyces sp. NPDC048462 TaxID=3365555 RepID=UPI003720EA8E
MSDPFSAAAFRALVARLGVDSIPIVDADGRPDVLLDRTGMEQLRDAARDHNLPEIADTVQRLLDHSNKEAA